MKNKNLLFLVAILLTMLAVPSCNFVEIDNPVINDIPKYRVYGTVQSADQATAIEGAKVIFGNLETKTNANGEYSFESTSPFTASNEIFVSKDGYANSLTNLFSTNEDFLNTEVNINLTRALPASFVDLSKGGVLVFDDVTITIPANNSATLNGETLQVVELSVTPLSPISTYGSFSGSAMKPIVFNPIGMEFNIPLTVSFQIPDGFGTESLILSQFNSESGTWEDAQSDVVFDSNSGLLSFQIKNTNPAQIVDPTSLIINTALSGNFIESDVKRFSKNNCDCGEVVTGWMGGLYWQKIELIALNGTTPTLSELAQIRFFQNQAAQIPFFGGDYTTYVTGKIISPVFLIQQVDQCEHVEVTFQRVYREVHGEYTYNNELKQFIFRFYHNVTPYQWNNIPCTVHNECHQGGCEQE